MRRRFTFRGSCRTVGTQSGNSSFSAEVHSGSHEPASAPACNAGTPAAGAACTGPPGSLSRALCVVRSEWLVLVGAPSWAGGVGTTSAPSRVTRRSGAVGVSRPSQFQQVVHNEPFSTPQLGQGVRCEPSPMGGNAGSGALHVEAIVAESSPAGYPVGGNVSVFIVLGPTHRECGRGAHKPLSAQGQSSRREEGTPIHGAGPSPSRGVGGRWVPLGEAQAAQRPIRRPAQAPTRGRARRVTACGGTAQTPRPKDCARHLTCRTMPDMNQTSQAQPKEARQSDFLGAICFVVLIATVLYAALTAT